jgi:hypothetical protein
MAVTSLKTGEKSKTETLCSENNALHDSDVMSEPVHSYVRVLTGTVCVRISIIILPTFIDGDAEHVMLKEQRFLSQKQFCRALVTAGCLSVIVR